VNDRLAWADLVEKAATSVLIKRLSEAVSSHIVSANVLEAEIA
jgi:hypothetical protein